MNQKELVTTIANLTVQPRWAVLEVLDCAAEIIFDTLANGDEAVSFPKLGTFKPQRRAQRRMVLPNGQERVIVGKLVAKFVPGKSFRQYVNGEI